MMETKRFNLKRISMVLFFVLCTGILLFINNYNDKRGVIDPVQILDLQIIDGNEWYIRYSDKEKAYELLCNKEPNIQFVFPKNTYAAYSCVDKCYYYIYDDKLMAFDPILKKENTLYGLNETERTVYLATENFLLLGDGVDIDGVLDLSNGSIVNISTECRDSIRRKK